MLMALSRRLSPVSQNETNQKGKEGRRQNKAYRNQNDIHKVVNM